MFPFFALVAGCAAHIDQAQIDAVLALSGDAGNGAQVYKGNCEDCHDSDGRGMKAAILPERVPMISDDDLVQTILSGPFIMPNFVNSLETQEVADVLSYVRDTWGEWDGTTEG